MRSWIRNPGCWFIVLGLLAPAVPANAASAVSLNRQTGAYRIYAQVRSKAEAERFALDSCRRRNRGSEAACELLKSCSRGGYGRVYYYQRGTAWAIGVECGERSAGNANEAAKRACNAWARRYGGRCGVRKGWYDPFNDEHVPETCKNRHPSQDPCYRPPG